MVKSEIVKNKEELVRAIKRAAGEKWSEGAMVKVVTADYPLTGRTAQWAKFKNFKELRVKVIGREKKDSVWIYECALAGGKRIGRTYATKVEAEEGDILEVRVAEVMVDEESGEITWDNPIVHSLKPRGTALTTVEEAKALSRLGRTRRVVRRAEEEEGEFGNKF